MGTLRDFFRDILSRSRRDYVKGFWLKATRFHCFELSHSLTGPPQKMTHGAGFRGGGAGAVGNRTYRTGVGSAIGALSHSLSARLISLFGVEGVGFGAQPL